MEAGERAPDFEAVDQRGERATLSRFLRDGPVVLFFFPRAMTPGCTAESCHFRDLRSELAALGARAIGISPDDVDRQAEFDRRHDLGLPLLSDPDRRIARIFGVKRPGPLSNRRTTFVIDQDRQVLATIHSELRMDEHADRALAVLRGREETNAR